MTRARYAIVAAVLFGAATPLAKLLLGDVPPVLLAGLLYLGSGLSLMMVYLVRDRSKDMEAPVMRSNVPWLAGAILCGGVLAPSLLMLGLSTIDASAASLLLNLEGVLTALLAWIVFREHFSARTLVGMGFIVLGAVILSWPESGFVVPIGSLAVVGACLCWGIDNNLTQKVSTDNPVFIAAVKGIVAGSVNTSIALSLGATIPRFSVLVAALAVGCVGYGVSLALFVLSLRLIGTARTGAYFSVAPFVGAALSLAILHEPFGASFLLVAALMGAGVWLHLTEKHFHEHVHAGLFHSHSHSHGLHHSHDHEFSVKEGSTHTHAHVHEPESHTHPHYPDVHHRHDH